MNIKGAVYKINSCFRNVCARIIIEKVILKRLLRSDLIG